MLHKNILKNLKKNKENVNNLYVFLIQMLGITN